MVERDPWTASGRRRAGPCSFQVTHSASPLPLPQAPAQGRQAQCSSWPVSGPACAQPKVPGPITDAQLEDWLQDTVGWAALEITAEAFLAAAAHPSQVKEAESSLIQPLAD